MAQGRQRQCPDFLFGRRLDEHVAPGNSIFLAIELDVGASAKLLHVPPERQAEIFDRLVAMIEEHSERQP
jgi:hypothetical protein